MDRAQDSSSSKQSEVVYDNKEVLMPIQISTVITLIEILRKELHSTNINIMQLREALEKDLTFSGFIKNQAGTQLITEHAITRNPTHKNVVEELNEDEPLIKPDESENKDETIIDKHAELGGEKSTAELGGEKSTDVGAEAMILVDGENEDTTSIDETSDDDDDDDDDGETDFDKAGETYVDKAGETHIDKPKHYYDPVRMCRVNSYGDIILPCCSPIPKYADSDEWVAYVAKNVANDKDLVALGVELLKPYQNDVELTSFNAQQYCETVDQFWESKYFLKALRDDLYEYRDCESVKDLSCYAKFYDVNEAPKDRIARIKRNPFFERLYLEGDDPVGILRGALTILVGYWTGYDLLFKLGKHLYAPDLPSPARVEIKDWLAGG